MSRAADGRESLCDRLKLLQRYIEKTLRGRNTKFQAVVGIGHIVAECAGNFQPAVHIGLDAEMEPFLGGLEADHPLLGLLEGLERLRESAEFVGAEHPR